MRVPRTFLFLDLSGFTNYTAAYGDDAAGLDEDHAVGDRWSVHRMDGFAHQGELGRREGDGEAGDEKGQGEVGTGAHQRASEVWPIRRGARAP